jgi:hypothetical protein
MAGWSQEFDDAIAVGLGELITLKDAAEYIQGLTTAEQQKPHWQLATEILINVAEGRYLVLHARIAMLRALHHGKPPPAPSLPSRKPAKRFNVIR